MIYNRWGELFYKNENYQNDWVNALFKREELNEGLYYYLINPESKKYNYKDVDIYSKDKKSKYNWSSSTNQKLAFI